MAVTPLRPSRLCGSAITRIHRRDTTDTEMIGAQITSGE
jgi:hypothetical protein